MLGNSLSPGRGARILNTLRTRQNGCHFAADTFKRIFLKENVRIAIKISLKFVPKSPIDNIPALFQIMAWRQPGNKPLSEAMMVSLLTHICIARAQWVKKYIWLLIFSIMSCTRDCTGKNVNDPMSTLVQVMAWCHQWTSYYLSHCWTISMSSYGIATSQ